MQLRSRALTLALSLIATVTVACEEVSNPLDEGDEEDPQDEQEYAEVTDQLSGLWGQGVESFAVRELAMGEIADGLESGSVTLPLVDEGGEIRRITVDSRRVQLRSPELQEGVMRSGATTDPGIERVPLPEEQNYVLGDCSDAESVSSETLRCGGVTLLDDDRTMLGGVVHHPDIGTAYIQPVDLALDQPATPGLHVVYNGAATPPVEFAGDEEPEAAPARRGGARGPAAARPHVQEATRIVLDGDVEFYDEDPSTVWRRQELNLLVPRIVYTLIEGNSAHRWELDLEIKGQEVWVSGGPSTTNGAQLNQTLGDPGYFLIHPVDDDEIHFFFVGYNVPGLYGRAGGIPDGGSSAFGDGSEQNNAWAQVRPAFSWKHQWIVITHEIGHLLGGRHGDGCSSCTSGSMSGFSLMPAGGAGGPESREYFFSDANDDNIQSALGSILP